MEPKPPTRVAIALLAIMALILIASLVFFYFVAIYGLSPREMSLAGVLFFLVAGPLLYATWAIAVRYQR